MANVNEPFVISGNNNKSAQVLVTETIDIERNQSVVSIALSVASASDYGYAYFIGGDLSVDGVALVTMSQEQGSWSVTPIPQNVYCEITGSPWSRVVGRNADGSKTITVSVDIEGFSPGAGKSFVVKGSVPVTLTQIPRASTIGATDANIGSASMIAVARKSTSYTHSIQYSFGALSGYVDGNGNAVGYEAKTDATSIAFNIPSSFYEQIATQRSAPCTLYCRTYLGDTQIGETQSCVFWAIAAESACAPQVIGSIEDSNPATIALTGNKYRLVRYVSNALCTISAVARNAAYITSKTIGGTAVSGNTRTINAIDAHSVMFSATDSRGYSTNTEVNIDMIPYIPLTCVASGKRDEPTDGTATISVKGNYYNGSFGASNNQLYIRYKQIDGDWNIATPTINGNSYTVNIPLTGLDYTKAFTFVVRVLDEISVVEQTVVINKGIPVFDWGESDFSFHVPVNFEKGGTGFAPAGYGLGNRGEAVIGDFNNYIVNGRWKFRDINGVLNAPPESGFGSLDVMASYDVIIQKVVFPNWSASEIRWFTMQRVNTYGGDPQKWSPWEYENPPMMLGVEYRTTERWNSKVVYTRIVDCLGAVDGAWVNLYTTYTTMIRYAGIFNNADTLPVENIGNYARIQVLDGYAVISQKGYDGLNIKVQLWYTKD